MKLPFTKMQGAGNDFVVLDCTRTAFSLSRDQLRKIADRHRGVGCDQILVVERPQSAAADFRYRIFNADGGEVEQCGNGARCFVKFVHDRGMTEKREITVETLGGLIRPKLEGDGEVSVDMGKPRYSGVEKVDGIELAIVSMGNPPSVAAGGYGFFDAAALFAAPWLVARLSRSMSPMQAGAANRSLR